MKKLLVCSTTLLLLALTARTQIFLSDSFDYPDGSIVGAAGSPWVNHSGAADQANVVAGQLELTEDDGEDINAPLAGAPFTTASGAVLFASFTVNFSALPAGDGDYFAHFKGSALSAFRGRLFASTNGAAPGFFRLSIANGTNAAAASVPVPIDLTLDATYTVVLRYEVFSAATTLWLNPATETDSGAVAADTASALSIASFAFRQSLSGGNGMGTLHVDDLKVGTNFAEVVNATPVVVTIVATDNQAAESGPNPGTFTFTRAGSTEADLIVYLQVGGTASNGVDYDVRLWDATPLAVIPDSVTIPAGVSSVTITVDPITDDETENNETVEVMVAPDAAYSLGAAQSATVTLLADGVNAVFIVAIDDAASETAGDTGMFELSRSGSTEAELPVQLLFGGTATIGKDYRTITNVVTIPAGAVSTTIAATAIDDSVADSGETIVVTVAPDAAYTVGDPGSAVVTIADNDTEPPPGLLIDEPFNYFDGPIVGAEGLLWLKHSGKESEANAVSGQLELTHAETEDINAPLPGAPYTAASGTKLYASFIAQFSSLPGGNGDFFAHFKSGSATGFRGRLYASTNDTAAGFFRLRIANGTNDTAGSVAVTTDLALDTPYLVVLRYDVANAASALWVNPAAESDSSAEAFDKASALSITSFAFRQTSGIGVLRVDDLKVGRSFAQVISAAPVSVSIIANDDRAFEMGAEPGSFILTRTGNTDAELLVNLQISGSAANGTDYDTLAETVTIPAGAASTLPITVTPIADGEPEPSETVILTLQPGAGYSLGATKTAIVTITDEALATVTIAATDANAAERGRETGTFTISRTSPITSELNVKLLISGTATNGIDYELIADVVTIPVGAASVLVTVTPIDDAEVEDAETVVLTLMADAAYAVSAANSATVTIGADNSQGRPQFRLPRIALTGAFEMNLIGEVGREYGIEVSTNLVQWTQLMTINQTNSTVAISDPAAINFPHRFYRAVLR